MKDMHKALIMIIVLVAILIYVEQTIALHEEDQEFPIIPEISCSYNESEGVITYSFQNPFDSPLHLLRASPLLASIITHASIIVNGRLVEPDEHCTKEVVAPGENVECSIIFDPNAFKTGIFRMFHMVKESIVTYKGERPRDVLRLRILHEGSKFRKNFKFDCVKE